MSFPKSLIVAIVFFTVASAYVIKYRSNGNGPWYLGCADRNGRELLLKTNKKPRIEGSLVYLEDDIFVYPETGMTCRIVRVKQVEEENSKKVLDKAI